MTSTNDHITEFLEFYFKTETTPDYAVLLDGDWGSGKTHLTKAVLEKLNVPYIYVSLYGKKHPSEIDSDFAEQVVSQDQKTPVVGKHVKDAFSGLSTKFLGVDLPGLAIQQIKKATTNRIIVFDDVERCELSSQDILGYINPFVERQKNRVIVLLNETEIRGNSRDDFNRTKEKVIGKSLKVRPDVRAALLSFSNQLPTETRALVSDQTAVIEQLFRSSQLGNLRILKQALGDFHRAFTPVHKALPKQQDGYKLLLREMMVLSFELRANRLSVESVRDRSHVGSVPFSTSSDEPEDEFAKVCRRYPDVNLLDLILAPELSLSLLVDGQLREKEIIAHLSQHQAFGGVRETPLWRIAWEAPSLGDDDLDKLLAKIDDKLNSASRFTIGPLLHLAGARLYALVGDLDGETARSLVALLTRHIDQMTLDDFDVENVKEMAYALPRSYGGFAFLSAETQQFREIERYAVEHFSRLRKNHSIARLQAAIDDADRSIDLLAAHFLADFDPSLPKLMSGERFVDVLCKLRPENQLVLINAFRDRYSKSDASELADAECEWMKSIQENLRARIDGLRLAAKIRLAAFDDQILEPLIAGASR